MGCAATPRATGCARPAMPRASAALRRPTRLVAASPALLTHSAEKLLDGVPAVSGGADVQTDSTLPPSTRPVADPALTPRTGKRCSCRNRGYSLELVRSASGEPFESSARKQPLRVFADDLLVEERGKGDPSEVRK